MQCFDEEEGGVQAYVWHLNTFFVPSLGILITHFSPNCGFVDHSKRYNLIRF